MANQFTWYVIIETLIYLIQKSPYIILVFIDKKKLSLKLWRNYFVKGGKLTLT